MPFHHDNEDLRGAYDQVMHSAHQGSITHHLVAAAGAFAAIKAYEQRAENSGKPATWDAAQNLIVQLAGSETHKIIDQRNLHDIDGFKTKNEAEIKARIALNSSKEFGPLAYQGATADSGNTGIEEGTGAHWVGGNRKPEGRAERRAEERQEHREHRFDDQAAIERKDERHDEVRRAEKGV